MIGLFFMNIAITIYQGSYSPLVGKLQNRIELMNEVFISLCGYQMLYFTDWIPEPDIKYQYGWIMCTLIVLQITLNLIIILYFGIKSIWLLIKKCFIKVFGIKQSKTKYLNSFDEG